LGDVTQTVLEEEEEATAQHTHTPHAPRGKCNRWRECAALSGGGTDLRDEDFQTALEKEKEENEKQGSPALTQTSRIAARWWWLGNGKNHAYMLLCCRLLTKSEKEEVGTRRE
jgi:hypothetical protein